MDTVGKRLKYIISMKHLSQGQFANLVKVAKQTLCNYVNDLSKPNYEFLCTLYKELNINLNWLITGEGEITNQTPNEALKNELRREFEELLKAKGL